MKEPEKTLSPVLYIPHGGGPLPLLGDAAHAELCKFLQQLPYQLPKPSAILVISAHWEEDEVTVTGAAKPSLIYDYAGFAEAAYQIEYAVPGSPQLAETIVSLLQQKGIAARADSQRGLDHGVFVPLKIIYPDADIPCLQMSLVGDLNPQRHIEIGKALSSLRKQNILVIGSGFSFHNMKAFFSQAENSADEKNLAFENWLSRVCCDQNLSAAEREQQLVEWTEAPFARYCQPREEHLLPLHVCYGLAGGSATRVFNGQVLGKKTSAFRW